MKWGLIICVESFLVTGVIVTGVYGLPWGFILYVVALLHFVALVLWSNNRAGTAKRR